MKKKHLLTCLLFAIPMLMNAQVKNGGFELWDTVYAGNYSFELDTLFGVDNPMGGTVKNWESGSGYGLSRTTDNHSGNYSIILHNWYNYAYESLTYKDSINYRPQYLQGFFKYITGGVDGISHGMAMVTLTKFNGISSDTIATGSYQFDSVNTYTPFQSGLNYFSSTIPDSITIYFINANTSCGNNVVCNLLYLDDITLTTDTLTNSTYFEEEEFGNLFPNPFTDEISIRINNFQPGYFKIFDCLGEKLFEKELYQNGNSIDLTSLPKGFYFFSFTTLKGTKKGKLIHR